MFASRFGVRLVVCFFALGCVRALPRVHGVGWCGGVLGGFVLGVGLLWFVCVGVFVGNCGCQPVGRVLASVRLCALPRFHGVGWRGGGVGVVLLVLWL